MDKSKEIGDKFKILIGLDHTDALIIARVIKPDIFFRSIRENGKWLVIHDDLRINRLNVETVDGKIVAIDGIY